MKTMKKILVLFLACALVLGSFAACGSKDSEDVTPTPEPTATTAPTSTTAPTATTAPAATEAPTSEATASYPAGATLLYFLDATNPLDAMNFSSRGDGMAYISNNGYNSAHSFEIADRASNWHGVSLDVASVTPSIIGKYLYVSYWVYQETGAPIAVSCTTQVVKPDGSQDWPAATRVANESVPSGEWTFVEGEIEIYSDITEPLIYWEATDTASFLLDNVTVAVIYDKDAGIGYPELAVVEAGPADVILSFDDDNLGGFGARGDGTPSIVDGTMYVSGRTSSWNGAQINFDASVVAGATLTVSFKVKHDEAAPIEVKCSGDQKIAGTQSWPNIAVANDVPAGEWTEVTGTYTIDAGIEAFALYFEATDTASFYIDDVSFTFELADPADTSAVAVHEDISLDFASDLGGFSNRGDGTPSLVDGAMYVSGRTSSWNGAGLSVDAASVEGATLNISYKVKHDEASDIEVKFTLEQSLAGTTSWPNMTQTTLAGGEWVEVSGTYTIDAGITSALFYFEATDTASFYIDDLTITFEREGGSSESSLGTNTAYGNPYTAGSIIFQCSFENASGTWLDGGNSYNYATVANATDAAYDGAESVLVSSREYVNAGSGIRIASYNGLSIAELQGHKVRFSAWVMYKDGIYSTYADTINFEIWNRLNKIVEDPLTYESVLVQPVNKGEWTELVAEFTIVDATDNGMILIGTNNEEAGAAGYMCDYYLDLVTITIIE